MAGLTSDPTDRATVLRDADIALRAWSRDDSAVLQAAFQDEEIKRWTPIPVPFTMAHVTEFISASEEYWADGLPNFAITFRGEMVGAIGFVARPIEGVLEVAYWLTPAGRGRGIAVSALRMMSVWALTDLGVDRVELTAYVGNVRSLAVASKARFRPEGLPRGRAIQRGTRRDIWMASLMKADLADID